MRFKSSVCPEQQSSQELIVLCHGEERVLVPMPNTYEEADEAAKQLFNLKGHISLETEDLHGYEGRSVRIHPAAWKGIGPLLKSINIQVACGISGEDTETLPRELTPTPQDSRAKETLVQSSNAQRADNAVTSSRPILLTPSSSTLSLRANAAKSVSTPKRSSPSKKREREPSPEDEDNDERPLSPSKTRLTRPRIMSDYEEDSAFDARHEAQYPRQRDELDRVQSALSHNEGSNKVTVKTEKPANAGVQSSSPSKQALRHQNEAAAREASTSAPQSDSGFLVSIEYGDDEEHRSLFKTRGRHVVSKVLLQACRTFGIEEHFDRARLVLVIEEEDGGEVVERKRVCANEDTMAGAGAEPDARFVIEIDEW